MGNQSGILNAGLASSQDIVPWYEIFFLEKTISQSMEVLKPNRCCMLTCVAVLGRNRTLFRYSFRYSLGWLVFMSFGFFNSNPN